MDIYLKALKLERWNQIESVDINFHEKLTVITGANGSGKTTLLNLLAKHGKWEVPSLGMPSEDQETWITTIESGDGSIVHSGEIYYSNGETSSVYRPAKSSEPIIHSEIRNMQQVRTSYLPSHRGPFRYEAVNSLDLNPDSYRKESSYPIYDSEARDQFYSGGGGSRVNRSIKSMLLGWSIYGNGNPDMEGRHDLLRNLREFESLLSRVLPDTIGFEKIQFKRNQPILKCRGSNDFLLDAASGGISSLIEIVWQIFMFSTGKGRSTVLIDEIENHLHPSMQRSILQDLQSAFPDVQFIVTTHSPLVVSSVRDSTIYVLRYNENFKIESHPLDMHDAMTATKVLNDVLGVSSTLPIWAEHKLDDIASKFSKLQEDEIDELIKDLQDNGLKNFIPSAVKRIAENDKA